jgi:alcohol dehydrogenase (cytochrome c)
MTDGAMITGSGLVFLGTPEGKLLALDEATGDTVWSTKTASGLNASPITYSEGGKQYLSILSGTGGVVSKFFAAAVPWLAKVPKGSLVYTWVLNSDGAMAPSGAMPASSPEAMPAATSPSP